jgi:hypothetical protein
MKKTLMLFALFLVMTVAGKAQTISQMQDTIATYAPHLPAVNRWTTADGKKWWGFNNVAFTHESQDTVVAWIGAYPSEAESYYVKVGTFLTANPPGTLPTDADREIYHNMNAVWLMIHAND